MHVVTLHVCTHTHTHTHTHMHFRALVLHAHIFNIFEEVLENWQNVAHCLLWAEQQCQVMQAEG